MVLQEWSGHGHWESRSLYSSYVWVISTFHLSMFGCGWKTVPQERSPASMATMRSGSLARQMAMRQPAAVASRAAVSLVAMPPVPHWLPLMLVSTCVRTLLLLFVSISPA